MPRFGAAALVALLCALPSFALAQDSSPDSPVPDARPEEERERERDEPMPAPDGAARDVPEEDDDSFIHERDYAQERPEPPAGPEFGEAQDPSEGIEVARDAGVGSPLAYGRQTVLEFGGTFLFSHRSETTQAGAAPFLGYFLFDGLELTFFALLRVIHVSGDDQAPDGTPDAEGQTDFAIQPLIEPSYHLALNDMVYVFAGLGLGLTIAEEPAVDFVVRPRIGLDVLIGRSAIFKPAFFMDLGVAEGLGAIGLEGGFSAMW